jgi:hypothetical protein
MDPLASKYLFNKTRRKFFNQTPYSNIRTSSINKVPGVGYTAKNRAILYTPIHGRVLYNTSKQVTPVNFSAIQTARGPLKVGELKNGKSENSQSGSGRSKKNPQAKSFDKSEPADKNVTKQETQNWDKKQELKKKYPSYNDPDDDVEDSDPDNKDSDPDNEDLDSENEDLDPDNKNLDLNQSSKNISEKIINSFQHPVFTVKKTDYFEPSTGAGKTFDKKASGQKAKPSTIGAGKTFDKKASGQKAAKKSSDNYLSGISFI